MSRRLLPAAVIVCLLGAACGNPAVPGVTFGSGKQFVPQVADFLDDVGLFPSVAVDSQGTPYVTYFGFLPKLKEGEILPTRPVTAPSLPAVLMTSTKDGIWSRGAVAIQKTIPNATIAFGPAALPAVKTITAENVNGTSLAVDPSGGFHVAWAADTGLWYAESTGTSFAAKLLQPMKRPLTTAGPLGAPSVVTASDGTPWVAYTLASGGHREVVVKTGHGGGWRTSDVATLPAAASAGKRVAMGVMSGDRPVVAYSTGSSVLAARAGPGATTPAWVSSTVENGADGVGLSVAMAKDGVHVAYYAGNEVHTAVSSNGTTWQRSTVASVGTGSNVAGRSTGIAVDDNGNVSVAWYDPGTDTVRLASASSKSPGTFKPVPTRDTSGGDMPSLATTSDGSALYLAWHEETSEDLMLGTYATVSGMAFAKQSPIPPPVSTVSGPCPPPTTKLVISAQGLAFDKTCLDAPPKKSFTVTFDNKETNGTVHNFVIYSQNPLSNPSAKDLGGAKPNQPVPAGQTVTFKVIPLPAGSYFFRCDFHPTSMTGVFQVK
jgi:hypothetical protein